MTSVGARFADFMGVGLAGAYLSQFSLDKTTEDVIVGLNIGLGDLIWGGRPWGR